MVCVVRADGCSSLGAFARLLRREAKKLEQMERAGIVMDLVPTGYEDLDEAWLVTEDPDVAAKYGLQEQKDHSTEVDCSPVDPDSSKDIPF
jgi:hypothetical protein